MASGTAKAWEPAPTTAPSLAPPPKGLRAGSDLEAEALAEAAALVDAEALALECIEQQAVEGLAKACGRPATAPTLRFWQKFVTADFRFTKVCNCRF